MLNRKGEGYVMTSVLIIIFCMIISSLVMLVNAINTVKLIKRNTVTVLNSYLTTNAVYIYDSIKQGNDSIDVLDETAYINSLRKFATLKKVSGNRLASKDSMGKTQYEITSPHMSFVTYVPIYFGGIKVSTAEVPVTVKAELSEKY